MTRLVLLLLIALYFFTRLYHLTILPIFFDEAIFIKWAKIIASSNQQWFIPFSGGKNILLPWLAVPFLKIFPPADFLIAGRIPSVIAGFFSILATYKIGRLLFTSKVALLASFFVTIAPFNLLYDRMALYDSLLCAVLAWTAYFTFKTATTLKTADGWKWGLALGIGHLAKATAIFYSLLTPLVFIILSYQKTKKTIFKLIAISFLTSQLVANWTIISRGYFEYQQKALAHTPTTQSLLVNPFLVFTRNISWTFDWLTSYYTLPIFITVLISFGYLLKVQRIKALAFLALTVVPVFIFCFIARDYFPRYLLFTTPIVFLSLSYFICSVTFRFKNKLLLKAFLVLGLLFLPLKFDYHLLTNPPEAELPQADNWQYITGFPSSYGFAPIYRFLDTKLRNGPVTLVVEGSYSHYPYAFELYYWNNKNITIMEKWPLEMTPEIRQATRNSQVYIVIGHTTWPAQRETVKRLPLEIVLVATKPGGQDPIYLTTLK